MHRHHHHHHHHPGAGLVGLGVVCCFSACLCWSEKNGPPPKKIQKTNPHERRVWPSAPLLRPALPLAPSSRSPLLSLLVWPRLYFPCRFKKPLITAPTRTVVVSATPVVLPTQTTTYVTTGVVRVHFRYICSFLKSRPAISNPSTLPRKPCTRRPPRLSRVSRSTPFRRRLVPRHSRSIWRYDTSLGVLVFIVRKIKIKKNRDRRFLPDGRLAWVPMDACFSLTTTIARPRGTIRATLCPSRCSSRRPTLPSNPSSRRMPPRRPSSRHMPPRRPSSIRMPPRRPSSRRMPPRRPSSRLSSSLFTRRRPRHLLIPTMSLCPSFASRAARIFRHPHASAATVASRFFDRLPLCFSFFLSECLQVLFLFLKR